MESTSCHGIFHGFYLSMPSTIGFDECWEVYTVQPTPCLLLLYRICRFSLLIHTLFVYELFIALLLVSFGVKEKNRIPVCSLCEQQKHCFY